MRRFAVVALAAAASLSAQSQRMTLTLPEADRLALQNSPRIASARLTAQAFGQEPAQYKSALYPQVGGSFTGAGSTSDSRIAAGGLNNPIIYSRMASGLSISQLLFDFGRTNMLTHSSTSRAAAEEQNANATSNTVLLRVHQAYFSALRSEAVLQVARQTVTSRQTVADQVKALADAKIKSGLDLSFANVNLSEAKLLLQSALNDREAANAQLAAVLGLSPLTVFDLTDVSPPPVIDLDLKQLIQDAYDSRPEIKAQDLRVQSSQEFAQAESKLKYPSVSAVATAGLVPLRVEGLKSADYAAAGLNISLPFLNGGLYKAREAEATLRARADEQTLRETKLEVARAVRLAYLNVTTASERLQLTDQLFENATQGLELAQSRYDLGLSSIVELSQAELAKTQAEIQRATARYDYALQRSVLDFESGQLR